MYKYENTYRRHIFKPNSKVKAMSSMHDELCKWWGAVQNNIDWGAKVMRISGQQQHSIKQVRGPPGHRSCVTPSPHGEACPAAATPQT